MFIYWRVESLRPTRKRNRFAWLLVFPFVSQYLWELWQISSSVWVYFHTPGDHASVFHYSEDLMRWKFDVILYCSNCLQYSTGEVIRVWNLGLTNSILNTGPSYSDCMRLWNISVLYQRVGVISIPFFFFLQEMSEMM